MLKSPRRPPRIRHAAVALAAGVTLAVAAGCASNPDAGGGPDPNKDEYVVGYSQANNAEPYRAQVNAQLEKLYIPEHKKLKLLPITDAQQDSTQQVNQVKQLIKQKIDVLMVSPNEPAPLAAPVEQACEANIPVIILDRTVNTDCYSSFIGGDNVQAGRKAGELALKLLPNGGNVAEITGLKSNQPQKDRHQGFAEAIKKNPKIEVVAEQEGKWLQEEGTSIMNEWLQRGEKIDLVFAHNDPMALGAQLAASKKQPDIKFIGVDGLAIPSGGIKAVESSKLDGTFIYPTGAEEAARTAADLAQGKKVEKEQKLDIEPVTPENAAELYEKYHVEK